MTVLFKTGWLCLNCGHKQTCEQGYPCSKCSAGPVIRGIVREPEGKTK